MKFNTNDQTKGKSIVKKVLTKGFLILILVGVILIMATYTLVASNYVYCHTLAICDPIRSTPKPEIVATQVAAQYVYAIKDIQAGRYEHAQQRLEYIIAWNPEYPGAAEKLLEVERILNITPTP